MSKKQKKADVTEVTNADGKLTIRFKQADTQLDVTVTGSVSQHERGKLYGSALNELYELVKLQANTGARIFKLGQPICISVQLDEALVFDTAQATVKLQDKLKLNRTPESWRRFAQRFVTIAEHVTRNREVVEINSVLARVDELIEARRADREANQPGEAAQG